MKVKEFIKKFKMSSNASVIVQAFMTDTMVELTRQQLRDIEPEYIMSMRVLGFDVIDNVLTIYAE